MPPLNRYIDLHCERTQPGLFEEPLNALSNLGFVIVAILLFRLVRAKDHQPFSTYFLIFMCGFIGIGSMVFHTTARMWAAMYMDVIPIAIFATTFIFLFAKHILRLNFLGTMLLVALLFFENAVFKSYVTRAPDGYVSLIPTAFFLIFVCIYMFITKNTSRKNFLIATIIAVVAIFFRATDIRFCETFPYGTHFLWHSLMSVFMYIVTREFIMRHRKYDALVA